MNTWLKSLLTGLAIAALIFFVSQKIARQNQKKLFNVHYTIEITPERGLAGQSEKEMKEVVYKIPGIIKRRCEAANYPASIRIFSNNTRLDINIQHVDDTLWGTKIIAMNNKLEFREIYTLNEIPTILTLGDEVAKKYLPLPPPKSIPGKKSEDSTIEPQVRKLLRNMEKNAATDEMSKSGLASILVFSTVYSANPGDQSSFPEIGSVKEKDTSLLNKILQSAELIQTLPRDVKFLYGRATDLSKGRGINIFNLYAIRKDDNEMAGLQNRYIESAKQDYSTDGQPEVRFRFNSTGAWKWEQMTRANIGRSIAIIFNNSIISAPRVNEAITGGSSNITGGFNVEEAILLAAQLNSGFIPAKLSIIKQDISPESSGNMGKFLLIILATFVVATGLAYLIFNTLKNR